MACVVLQLVKELTMSAGSKSALQPNIVFDQSGKLILYAALPGIKIVNLVEVLSFLHAKLLLRSFSRSSLRKPCRVHVA